jgi:hypothetical protein
MQLIMDKKVFDWVALIASLLFGFTSSLIFSAVTGESFGSVLQFGLWAALPFAFFFRTLIRVSRKRRYKKLPPTYLTAIGCYLNQLELVQLILLVLAHGRKTVVTEGEGGEYYCLHLSKGIEIWTAVNKRKEVEMLLPFFRGTNCNRVKISEALGSRKTSYEGAFLAWRGEDPADLEGFPFVFSVPDFAYHAGKPSPYMADIALTAFASQLLFFHSETEYLERQGEVYKIAAKSFFASGMLQQDPGPGEHKMPSAQAVFTGTILDARFLENRATRMTFLWLQVDTLQLVIEVVADRRLLKKLPVKGSIVKVTGWLTGDWLEHDRQ